VPFVPFVALFAWPRDGQVQIRNGHKGHKEHKKARPYLLCHLCLLWPSSHGAKSKSGMATKGTRSTKWQDRIFCAFCAFCGPLRMAASRPSPNQEWPQRAQRAQKARPYLLCHLCLLWPSSHGRVTAKSKSGMATKGTKSTNGRAVFFVPSVPFVTLFAWPRDGQAQIRNGPQRAQRAQNGEAVLLVPFVARHSKWRTSHTKSQDEFANLQFACAKIYEQSVAFSRGAKVAQYLRHMVVRERPAGFKFDDQTGFDKQVGEIVAKKRSILIADFERITAARRGAQPFANDAPSRFRILSPDGHVASTRAVQKHTA